MTLINLESLRRADVKRDPFDFMVVPNFLGAEDLARVNSDYPAIDTPANHDLETLSYGPVFRQLMEEMQGSEFVGAMGEKFDLKLDDMPITITARKFCERTDGNIHTDHKSKVLTVLLYFNADWSSPDGRLRLLRSDKNIEDYAAEVPPVGGTLLAFRRTDHSWHGHTSFVGERRMVQVNFLDNSLWSQVSQQVSRFSTRFAKNVLGMR